MSRLERSLSWLERAVDWMNPILVKETRQALKSRQFVITFTLMLAISWFLFFLGVGSGGKAIEYGTVGSRFFEWFYWILTIAVVLVVPFTADLSLFSERDHAAYDLLSITTLTPQQIVWGKLLSALVQILIFYSAIAPFIAFTSLLQGFDFVYVFSKLTLTGLLSLFLIMLAIANATTHKRQGGVFSLVGGLIGIFFVAMLSLWILSTWAYDFDPANIEELAGLVFAIIVWASYFVLLQKIATARLTFESDDHSSGIRSVGTRQFFLLWGGMLAFTLIVGSSYAEELAVIAMLFYAVHLAILGLFVCTEKPLLSRRILRKLPQSKIRRLWHVPYLQGGSRGYLYSLIHIGLFVGFNVLFEWLFGWPAEVPLAIAAYLVIYLGIACLLSRWLDGLSSKTRPGHARMLTIILLVACCTVPYIPMLLGDSLSHGYSLTLIVMPFHTLAHLADSGYYTGTILVLLGNGSMAAVLVNLRALKQGIAQVVNGEIKPRTLGEEVEVPQTL